MKLLPNKVQNIIFAEIIVVLARISGRITAILKCSLQNISTKYVFTFLSKQNTAIAEIVGAAACIPYRTKQINPFDTIPCKRIAAKGSRNEMIKNKIKFLCSCPIVYLLFMTVSLLLALLKFPKNNDLFNCLTLLFYHTPVHNSINFYLILLFRLLYKFCKRYPNLSKTIFKQYCPNTLP